MTNDEADKVISIMFQADGECYCCAKELIQMFIQEFPEYRVLSMTLYERRFKKKLFEEKN